MDYSPVPMESLITDTEIEIGRLSELLLGLELHGLLKRLPGNFYIRVG
jgi:predicted Rossmann fold nucleotide-binding protein DprA/Smf involved in DNA uptake